MNDTLYSTNAIPELTKDVHIPIKVTTSNGAGSYKVFANEIDNMPSGSSIILEDLKTGTKTDLRNKSIYTFTTTDTSETIAPRFMLHVSATGTSGLSTIDADNKSIHITSNLNGTFVKFDFTQPVPAMVSIYNMLGQKVIEDLNVEASNQTMKLMIPQEKNNLLIVKVQTTTQQVIKKIYNQ